MNYESNMRYLCSCYRHINRKLENDLICQGEQTKRIKTVFANSLTKRNAVTNKKMIDIYRTLGLTSTAALYDPPLLQSYLMTHYFVNPLHKSYLI